MDLELVESNDGGDLVKNKKDLSVINGFENMIYLALFGGNVLESTPSTRNASQQRFDYWGNDLLMQNDPSIQFNSLTERTLSLVALGSSGRSKIEQVVKRDLEFMQEFCDVSVSVSIMSIDRVSIQVTLKEPGNIQRKDFIFIWDATNKELIDRKSY